MSLKPDKVSGTKARERSWLARLDSGFHIIVAWLIPRVAERLGRKSLLTIFAALVLIHTANSMDGGPACFYRGTPGPKEEVATSTITAISLAGFGPSLGLCSAVSGKRAAYVVAFFELTRIAPAHKALVTARID
jgi:hypothetical protein